MIQQYDKVKVVALLEDRGPGFLKHNKRLPVIGDVGYVLEVYFSPRLTYEVECFDPSQNGATVWLDSMLPGEIELIKPE